MVQLHTCLGMVVYNAPIADRSAWWPRIWVTDQGVCCSQHSAWTCLLETHLSQSGMICYQQQRTQQCRSAQIAITLSPSSTAIGSFSLPAGENTVADTTIFTETGRKSIFPSADCDPLCPISLSKEGDYSCRFQSYRDVPVRLKRGALMMFAEPPQGVDF